jgi:hypothetical protein
MKLARIAAALLALVAAVLVIVAVLTLRSRKIGTYRPATATLVAKEPARGEVQLKLSYAVGGQQELLTQSVPASSPDAMIPIGGKRIIAYDRHHPALALLNRPSLLLPTTLFGSAAVLFAAVGLLLYLSRKPA